MSSTDDTKPAAKTGRRNRKGEARRQKPEAAESPAPVEVQAPEVEQPQVPQPDPEAAVSEPLEAVVAEAMAVDDNAVSADAPSLAEISGPVYQRFLDSGTTDEQLSQELEEAKHQMRAERRGRDYCPQSLNGVATGEIQSLEPLPGRRHISRVDPVLCTAGSMEGDAR